MIDTSGEWWVGENADDITEYLVKYSQDKNIDTKQVKCRKCGNDSLYVKLDYDENAIQVECPECKHHKIILDCEDVWEDSEPEIYYCPICRRKTTYNINVGFTRRENGSAKWVYIGNMCTACHTLGSFMDWKIDFEPTDKMENNI